MYACVSVCIVTVRLIESGFHCDIVIGPECIVHTLCSLCVYNVHAYTYNVHTPTNQSTESTYELVNVSDVYLYYAIQNTFSSYKSSYTLVQAHAHQYISFCIDDA